MKKIFFALILAACLTAAFAYNPLPECYHTYDEIYAELLQIESQYPAFAKLYTIGFSEVDNLPIYAMKLSDNVASEENEPAVVFVGQVHAEEVLGVETTMSNISEILQNMQTPPYGNWIAQLEMWFIPTLNPEGHNVVSSFTDVTYRKNKRDMNNNGVFDFVFGSPGYDLDGVDINRNFAFNWCHGDTLWALAGEVTEPYDYYRGPALMSESETQAFAAFCRQHKPVFAIIWHSSRTGNLSEQVFYPSNWWGIRPAPDLALGQQIGEGVAQQIQKLGSGGYYEPSATKGRKGGANDWLYQQFGTICLVIECGTNDIQPVDTTMVKVVTRNTNGVKWLLNRALPTSSAVPSSSMLRGVITDAVTGLPLEAEIIVEQRKAPWFAPRKSDPVNGSYWRPVSAGSYTLRFRKKGYAEHVIYNQNINNGSWTNVPVQLQPLPPVTIHGSVRSSYSNTPIAARVVIYDIENDTLQVNGNFVHTTYPGTHRVEISADGYYPYIGNLDIQSGTQAVQLNVVLTPYTVHFSEDWENGLQLWIKNYKWVTQNVLSVSGYALTDSWGGKGFYPQNCNNWIRTSAPIAIPASGNPLLMFDQHLYTEFVYDSVRVEVSADTLSWQTIYSNSGQYDWWHPVYIPLDQYAGQSIYLRFRLTDQSNDEDLTDPGWTIDNLKIITGSATPNLDESMAPLPFALLYPNYPNPFRTETTLKYSLGTDSPVSLAIYNIRGQKIKTLHSGMVKRGTYTLQWDGKDDHNAPAASGIYFARLTGSGTSRSQKLLLLK
jgi:hypothetical protein